MPSTLTTEHTQDPNWPVEKRRIRELMLEEKWEEMKKILEILEKYKEDYIKLKELLFDTGNVQSKDTAEEKFGKEQAFTRIHDGKSAWMLMLWSHNYDSLFEPLKVFFNSLNSDISDRLKEDARTQTPLDIFNNQSQLMLSATSTSSASTASTENEKKEETRDNFDFKSLIKTILKDPCTDYKVTTSELRAKLEEFEKAFLKIEVLSLKSTSNVQILRGAYSAYADCAYSHPQWTHSLWKDSPLSLEQLIVFAERIIKPLVFSLPSGFSSHIHHYGRHGGPGFLSQLSHLRQAGMQHNIMTDNAIKNDLGWSTLKARDDLDKACKNKTKDFSQVLAWLESSSQKLVYKPTS